MEDSGKPTTELNWQYHGRQFHKANSKIAQIKKTFLKYFVHKVGLWFIVASYLKRTLGVCAKTSLKISVFQKSPSWGKLYFWLEKNSKRHK